MKYHMKVAISEIAGFSSSMRGLSLMRRQPIENMANVASRLCFMRHGHDKFLEHIVLWFMIEAPRYWWVEADTYRVGTSKQSESTIYDTLKNFKMSSYEDFVKLFEDEDLTIPQYEHIVSALGIEDKNERVVTLKRRIPEGLIQKREWMFSLKTYTEMLIQRHDHVLPHWQIFLSLVYKVLPADCKSILDIEGCYPKCGI